MLIHDKAIVGDDCSDLVLLLLSTNEKHLVVDLDGGEVSGKDFSVAETDGVSGLRGKLVNHQVVAGIVIVVKARLILREDEVRLKGDHIMQEASELVYFRSDNDVWARVVIQVNLVLVDLRLEIS